MAYRILREPGHLLVGLLLLSAADLGPQRVLPTGAVERVAGETEALRDQLAALERLGPVGQLAGGEGGAVED
jgi:hypothetical protein